MSAYLQQCPLRSGSTNPQEEKDSSDRNSPEIFMVVIEKTVQIMLLRLSAFYEAFIPKIGLNHQDKVFVPGLKIASPIASGFAYFKPLMRSPSLTPY